MNLTRGFACLLLGLGLVGCDDSHPALTRTDGGGSSPGADASPDTGPPVDGPLVTSTCGAGPVLPIHDTMPDIEIDTRGSSRTIPSLCGEASGGPQAFVAIDMLAGEYWHVHLSPSSSEARPRLALLGSECDPRGCVAAASFCDGLGDEHFGFVANSSGRRWIAVDDATLGGGVYQLSVFRPTCGDGVAEHGESCDDGNRIDGDGCDRRCRRELSDAIRREVEPNDDLYAANVLRLRDGALAVTGALGGPGACAYPDVFTLPHPGGTLRVEARPADGACDGSSEAPVRVRLMTASGSVLLERNVDLSDCAVIEQTFDVGEISIELSAGARPVALEYELAVQVEL